MRIMLDTMIYDAIVANPEAMRLVMFLTEKGTLNIVTTHIQEDQLAGITDDAKRRAILSIPTSKVATNGAGVEFVEMGRMHLGQRQDRYGYRRFDQM